MIYFIVTTSLFKDCPIRKSQYINGITTLKRICQNLALEDYTIIVVENNGVRKTFLDDFNLPVHYTMNNFLPFNNKGVKELQDVFDTIKQYRIQDSDFIVKMTGRYILKDDSEFMKALAGRPLDYDAIIKFGFHMNPATNYNLNDCNTGLIGMKCSYVKKIERPTTEPVEWKWAKCAKLIDMRRIFEPATLGIAICPASNTYINI